MQITQEERKETFKEFGGSEKNTGSMEAHVFIEKGWSEKKIFSLYR